MTAIVLIGIVVVITMIAAPQARQPGRTPDGGAKGDRSLLGLSAVAVAGLLAGPVAMVLVALVVYVRSVLQRRTSKRDFEQQIHTGLAEVIDLFAVALASGHNLYATTQRVAQWSSEPFGPAFADCVAAVDQGRPLSDSFDVLPAQLGSAVQPLVSALVAHERYGAPIAQNLVTLAAESRRARRHQAEVLARRLPVILLGPLVVCVLPAFLLLTVVPLVVDTLGSFTQSFGS